MKEIYFLSGLGADKRVFKSIILPSYKVNHIEWILPLTNESIEGYSKRLVSQINSSHPILLGLSFGGMMAVEISKHIEIEKIILISSAKTKKEIPFYFRWIGFLRINKILSAEFLKKSNPLTNWFFGVSSSEDKRLLKDILKETDPIFLKWAIDKIVNWSNAEIFKNRMHIHGSADKILPIQFVKYDFKIEGGGHLMILNKAGEINKILNDLI